MEEKSMVDALRDMLQAVKEDGQSSLLQQKHDTTLSKKLFGHPEENDQSNQDLKD